MFHRVYIPLMQKWVFISLAIAVLLLAAFTPAVFAGYRALHQDYTDGSGDDKFKWDVRLDGPILGFRIDF